MGMYTTLLFDAPLSEKGRAIVEKLIDHENYTDNAHGRWGMVADMLPEPALEWLKVGRKNFIPFGALSYVPTDDPDWDNQRHDIDGGDVWHVRCSLKNYTNEIAMFLVGVLPYLISEHIVAYTWYEEDDEPRLVSVVPQEWPRPRWVVGYGNIESIKKLELELACSTCDGTGWVAHDECKGEGCGTFSFEEGCDGGRAPCPDCDPDDPRIETRGYSVKRELGNEWPKDVTFDMVFDENDLRQRLVESLKKFIGRTLISEASLENIRSTIAFTLRQMEAEGGKPFRFFVYEVEEAPDRIGQVNFYLARNFALYPATEEEFEELVGRPPVQDDLHRLNCDKVGEFGHMQCGWCLRHGRMRMECGCLVNNTKTIYDVGY